MRRKALATTILGIAVATTIWLLFPVVKDAGGTPAVNAIVGGALRVYRDQHGANPPRLTAIEPYLNKMFPHDGFRVRELSHGKRRAEACSIPPSTKRRFGGVQLCSHRRLST